MTRRFFARRSIIAVAPLSSGRVSLKSPDPLLLPAIDLGWLTDPEGIDAKVMLAAIRLARQL